MKRRTFFAAVTAPFLGIGSWRPWKRPACIFDDPALRRPIDEAAKELAEAIDTEGKRPIYWLDGDSFGLWKLNGTGTHVWRLDSKWEFDVPGREVRIGETIRLRGRVQSFTPYAWNSPLRKEGRAIVEPDGLRIL